MDNSRNSSPSRRLTQRWRVPSTSVLALVLAFVGGGVLAPAASAAPTAGPGIPPGCVVTDPGAPPYCPPACEITAETDRQLYNVSLQNFGEIRESVLRTGLGCPLDYSTDGCSSSPDSPFGFEFTPACHRHDFGYRNYKNQGRFTPAAKSNIDLNFKRDMDNLCETVQSGMKPLCLATSKTYYEAVVLLG